MKRLLTTFLWITLAQASTLAQTVEWASKVIEFSSQLTTNQYSAEQALGKPNVLPGSGDNPVAWTNDKPNRKEFLKLGFSNPMTIQQIAIAESWNPSALTKILVYDEAGKEYEISVQTPSKLSLKSRMLNVFFKPTTYKVNAVKLEFDGSAVSGHFAIDAVAISDSKNPIIADIPMDKSIAAGITVEKLGSNVNSEYRDLNPLITTDGKTMYFSRRNHPGNVGGTKDHEDIWYSEYDENTHTWKLAQNLSDINTIEPNFLNSISVTPDRKSVVLLVGNKVIHGKKSLAGVSISTHIGDKWTEPKHVDIVNDYNYSEFANYFLTNSQSAMLMSVQRIDSKGDRDLYVSFMQKDSTWTEPKHLGPTVNTVAEESAPFLAIDDKTMYFASKGFSGYGGADVYMSRRLDDTWTNWSPPVNLGNTINTEYDDQYFHVSGMTTHSYYSRGVSETNTDIFKAELPPELAPEFWVTVKGKLIDHKTNKPLGAKIIYQRLPDGKDLGFAVANPETGEFEFKLPVGFNYSIRAEANDFISESQHLDLRNYDRDLHETVEFRLRPIEVVKIEKDALVRLNNIFFDFNKFELKPESFPELDRLVEILINKPGLTIEVEGHTDNVGTHHHNQKLSEHRANAVQKYLLSKGIATNKVTSRGFGETKPIATNDSEIGGREFNRRVEFKITGL
jgi:OmpA-OmpF porin, OOP family